MRLPLLALVVSVLAGVAAAPATAQTTPARWTTHNDASGFSIDTPPEWSVARGTQQGSITVSGRRGEQAVVWPMFIDGKLDARGAAGLVMQLARKVDSQLTWSPLAPAKGAKGNVVRVLAAGLPKSGAAMMTWSAVPKGTTVFFYCVEAPSDVYRASTSTLAGILGSFRVMTDSSLQSAAAANSPPAAAPLKFVRWNEPHEGMFSMAVPQGWQVLGGAYRLSATDVRTGELLSSPDNRIRVMLGDASIPLYIVPSAMLAAAGLHEGGAYMLGDGTRMEIRRYIPGQAYARAYVQAFAQKQCPGLQFESNNARQDLAAKFAQAARAEGIPSSQLSAGDAAFTCTLNGAPMKGSLVAATIVPFAGPAPMWSVYRLYGYLAAPGFEPVAGRVVQQALDSVRMNPAWQAQQQQIAGNAVAADNLRSRQIQSRALAAIQEDQRAINNTIVKGYEERSKVYDEISRKRENAILGTLDVVDPESGTRYKVSNYSDYHWMNNVGVIGGNNTGTSPGPDWRELITLP